MTNYEIGDNFVHMRFKYKEKGNIQTKIVFDQFNNFVAGCEKFNAKYAQKKQKKLEPDLIEKDKKEY